MYAVCLPVSVFVSVCCVYMNEEGQGILPCVSMFACMLWDVLVHAVFACVSVGCLCCRVCLCVCVGYVCVCVL